MTRKKQKEDRYCLYCARKIEGRVRKFCCRRHQVNYNHFFKGTNGVLHNETDEEKTIFTSLKQARTEEEAMQKKMDPLELLEYLGLEV